MKKIILIVLLTAFIIPSFLYSQTKDELKENVSRLEKIIDSLINESTSLRKQLKISDTNFNTLKDITQETYKIFDLYEAVKNKYNDVFFKNTKYKNISITDFEKIYNGELIMSFILMTDDSISSRYKLAERTHSFNLNWIQLDSITKYVIEKKYDSGQVNAAMSSIKTLPPLEKGTELNKYKMKMDTLLNQYNSINCLALKGFHAMSENMISGMKLGVKLSKLQQNTDNYIRGIAEEYTYLHTVFKAVKSDPHNYGKEEYAIPNTCPTIKEHKIEEQGEVKREESDNESQQEEKIKLQNTFIVDVRTLAKFTEKSIEGAVNIPLSTIEENIEKFKGKEQIIIYCENEHNAEIAIDILKQHGISNAVSGVGQAHLEEK